MRLSIVISTRNRAAFIVETITSIVDQLPADAELIVFDGASTDDTTAVVTIFVSQHRNVHYVRADVNSGIDADYDYAVGHAAGDYCWLMTDDDILLPGAVVRVMTAINRGPDLIIVDSETRDVTLDRRLEPRRLPFSGERTYGIDETDRLLAETGDTLSFIGGTIIRRTLWLARDRQRFYGTLFVHVGVIFQAPLTALAIGEPLIAIRLGNAMWTGRSFEIWMFKWPDLIWSLPASAAAKAAVTAREPWRQLTKLIAFRGSGAATRTELRTFFADRRIGPWRSVLLGVVWLPGIAVNVAAMLFLAGKGHARGAGGYTLAHASRFSNPITRWLASR